MPFKQQVEALDIAVRVGGADTPSDCPYDKAKRVLILKLVFSGIETFPQER
jgi:hypothetical protein